MKWKSIIAYSRKWTPHRVHTDVAENRKTNGSEPCQGKDGWAPPVKSPKRALPPNPWLLKGECYTIPHSSFNLQSPLCTGPTGSFQLANFVDWMLLIWKIMLWAFEFTHINNWDVHRGCTFGSGLSNDAFLAWQLGKMEEDHWVCNQLKPLLLLEFKQFPSLKFRLLG
jgi:hypothetical protein